MHLRDGNRRHLARRDVLDERLELVVAAVLECRAIAFVACRVMLLQLRCQRLGELPLHRLRHLLRAPWREPIGARVP